MSDASNNDILRSLNNIANILDRAHRETLVSTGGNQPRPQANATPNLVALGDAVKDFSKLMADNTKTLNKKFEGIYETYDEYNRSLASLDQALERRTASMSSMNKASEQYTNALRSAANISTNYIERFEGNSDVITTRLARIGKELGKSGDQQSIIGKAFKDFNGSQRQFEQIVKTMIDAHEQGVQNLNMFNNAVDQAPERLNELKKSAELLMHGNNEGVASLLELNSNLTDASLALEQITDVTSDAYKSKLAEIQAITDEIKAREDHMSAIEQQIQSTNELISTQDEQRASLEAHTVAIAAAIDQTNAAATAAFNLRGGMNQLSVAVDNATANFRANARQYMTLAGSFGLLLSGLNKVADQYRTVADAGLAGQMIGLGIAATKAGITLQEMVNIIKTNKLLYVQLGSNVEAVTAIINGNRDKLKEFGLNNAQAAAAVMAMGSAALASGESLESLHRGGLQKSIAEQTKLYTALSAVTGESIEQLAKNTQAMFEDGELLEYNRSLSDAARVANNKYLQIEQSRYLLMGLSNDQALEAIKLANRKKHSVGDRYSAGAQVKVLGDYVGMDRDKSARLNELTKKRILTDPEKKEIEQLATELKKLTDVKSMALGHDEAGGAVISALTAAVESNAAFSAYWKTAADINNAVDTKKNVAPLDKLYEASANAMTTGTANMVASFSNAVGAMDKVHKAIEAMRVANDPLAKTGQTVENIRDQINSIMNNFAPAILAALGTLGLLKVIFGKMIMNVGKSIGSGFMSVVKSFGTGIANMFKSFKSLFSSFATNGIGSTLKTVGSKLAAALKIGIKGFAKKIPLIGPLVAAAFGIADYAEASNIKDPAEKEKQQNKAIGSTTGGIVGSIAGGLLGSLLGPVGTVAGTVIGGLIGDWVGGLIGENFKKLKGWWDKQEGWAKDWMMIAINTLFPITMIFTAIDKFGTVKDKLIDAFTVMRDGVGKFVSDIPGWIRDKLKSVGESLPDWMSSSWNKAFGISQPAPAPVAPATPAKPAVPSTPAKVAPTTAAEWRLPTATKPVANPKPEGAVSVSSDGKSWMDKAGKILSPVYTPNTKGQPDDNTARPLPGAAPVATAANTSPTAVQTQQLPTVPRTMNIDTVDDHGSGGQSPNPSAKLSGDITKLNKYQWTNANIIKDAAAQIGVDGNTLMQIGWNESKFDAGAVNPKGGASGLFQFVKGTWPEYVKQLKGMGIASPDIFNPVHNSLAGALYLKASSNSGVSQEDSYLAHFAGVHGAKTILANPNTRVDEIVDSKGRRIMSEDKLRKNPNIKRDWTGAQMANYMRTTKGMNNQGINRWASITGKKTTGLSTMPGANGTTGVNSSPVAGTNGAPGNGTSQVDAAGMPLPAAGSAPAVTSAIAPNAPAGGSNFDSGAIVSLLNAIASLGQEQLRELKAIAGGRSNLQTQGKAYNN